MVSRSIRSTIKEQIMLDFILSRFVEGNPWRLVVHLLSTDEKVKKQFRLGWGAQPIPAKPTTQLQIMI